MLKSSWRFCHFVVEAIFVLLFNIILVVGFILTVWGVLAILKYVACIGQ